MPQGRTPTDIPWPGPRQIGVAAVMSDPARRVLLVKHTYGKLNWNCLAGSRSPGSRRMRHACERCSRKRDSTPRSAP